MVRGASFPVRAFREIDTSASKEFIRVGEWLRMAEGPLIQEGRPFQPIPQDLLQEAGPYESLAVLVTAPPGRLRPHWVRCKTGRSHGRGGSYDVAPPVPQWRVEKHRG